MEWPERGTNAISMKLNSIVVVSLHSPREKIWGELLGLNAAGVTLRGLDLNAFDDWLNQVNSEGQVGLATVFYPLYRVERIALDEPVGNIPSLAATFYQKIGLTLLEYLNKASA
ncbi:MAG: hypothetical protein DMG06_24605 [Acidobacteria bacterium]|nr:MAG: hypothetical protein DMG06_24605 [Acidobacteriota bacterium]